MGARGNTGGKAKQTLWRTGALRLARDIKHDVAMIVSRFVYHSGAVWVDQADRKPGDPYKVPREWHQYIENKPELLHRTADELEQIARAAAALAKSCRRRAGEADAEIVARRQAGAAEVGRLTAERLKSGAL